MDTIIKATAGALISLILSLVLSKNNKDVSMLLSTAVCCMLGILAFTCFQPVMEFMRRLQVAGELNTEFVSLLLKASGIYILSEIAALICTDAGNAALGKTLQFLATALILYMSLPMFSQLLSLIETILGEL